MTNATAQSLTEAVEAHYEELKAFVLRRTGSASMASDIVQETWVRAATATIALPDNPRAYLFRMVSNLVIDHMRREQVRGGDGDTAAELRAVACPHPAPDRVVGARQQVALLAAAVDELPKKCRLVFLLYRGRGLSMRQIAERLGLSEKTVEKHIARAMLHCRQRLRSAGYEL